MSEVKSVLFKISTTSIEEYAPSITPTPVLRCGEQPPEGGDLYSAFARRRRRAQKLARRVLYGLNDCKEEKNGAGAAPRDSSDEK